MASEEVRAEEYRTSQVRRCRAEAARLLRLSGSGSAARGLYDRTEAVRRDDDFEGFDEDKCTENLGQAA